MQEWIVGGLYSVRAKNDFNIVKVLAVDEVAVHVRVYKQCYDSRPNVVDPSTLTLGTIYDEDGFGMGHLPLSQRELTSWEPAFLCQSTVIPEELEGYRLWREHNGGIWDLKR
jgi:hypothetical protein